MSIRSSIIRQASGLTCRVQLIKSCKQGRRAALPRRRGCAKSWRSRRPRQFLQLTTANATSLDTHCQRSQVGIKADETRYALVMTPLIDQLAMTPVNSDKLVQPLNSARLDSTSSPVKHLPLPAATAEFLLGSTDPGRSLAMRSPVALIGEKSITCCSRAVSQSPDFDKQYYDMIK